MEFAELIHISRVDNVRLRRPAEDPCDVTVAITGHHLIMSIQVCVENIPKQAGAEVGQAQVEFKAQVEVVEVEAKLLFRQVVVLGGWIKQN